jgi:very-short-patch-repair endonuclease
MKPNHINRDEYYPKILIPSSLKKSIRGEVSQQDIEREFGLVAPVENLLTRPNRPPEYTVIEKTKYKFSFVAVFLFVVGVCMLLLSSSSGENEALIPIGLIISSIFIQLISTESHTERVSTPMMEFNRYTMDLRQVVTENEKRKTAYEEELKCFWQKVEAEKNILKEKNMMPTRESKPMPISETAPNQGRFEEFFYTAIMKCKESHNWNIEVKMHQQVRAGNSYFFPDILCVHSKGVHIDIEIDEAYTARTLEPIHYVTTDNISIDENRDDFFLNNNWIVLRFSEAQVALYPSECLKLLKCIINSINSNNLDLDNRDGRSNGKRGEYLNELYNYSYLPDRLWTETSAKQMAEDGYRDEIIKKHRKNQFDYSNPLI